MSDNKLKLIQDIELDNLNDENDFLETRKYSKTLQEIIKHTHTPCTIGLFGEWGSGKSSIIRDVINKLDFNKNKQYYNNTGEKIRFVVYDAWKYSKDSFRRTFLLEVAKELKLNYVRENDRFYTSKTQDLKISQKFNWKYLVMFLLFFIVVWVIFFCLEKIKLLSLDYLYTISIVAFLSFIATFSKNILSDYKTTIQEPLMFAPEQFENEFDNMHSVAFKKHNIDNEFFPPILHEANIDKLIIVVDNLDRCNADTVCEMLSDIKGFLNKDKVVFIVPLDDKMLKKHLAKNNDYEDSESEEYLRKIFSRIIRIKKTKSVDMFDAMSMFLIREGLSYNNLTIKIASEEYASNPRRIIKFINNFEIEKRLLFNKKLYEFKKSQKDISEDEHIKNANDFIDSNESLIAFLLILREEWFEIYDYIIKKIDSIKDIYNVKKEVYGESNNNYCLMSFLRSSINIWSYANVKIVHDIVYNFAYNKELPLEIQDMLDNNKLDMLCKHPDFEIAIKYLVRNLLEATQEVEFFENFETIVSINFNRRLDNFYFGEIINNNYGRIFNIFKYFGHGVDNIKYIIKFINDSRCYNYNNIYNNYLENLKAKYSDIDVLKDKYEKNEALDMLNSYGSFEEIYTLGFEYFLNYQMYNQEDLENYQEYFYTHSYFNHYKPYLNLNDEVLKLIINESIIDKLLQIKFKNGSDLHKLMQKLLAIEVINHSQYCKSIFNIEDTNSVRKLLTFRKFVKNNQSKNITLDGYTHLCVNCIKDCKTSSKEILEFFIDYFNEDENLYIIINNILEQEKIFEKQSEFIKYCLSRDIKLNTHIANCFEKILLANKSDSVSIDILKDLYIKSFLSIYDDFITMVTIEDRMLDVIENIDSDIGKNMQKMLIDLANNQELSKLVIGIVKEGKKRLYSTPPMNNELQEMRNKYAKLTPEFKETFFKGEAL